MKIDYWKLAQMARLGFCVLFATLTVFSIVAASLGYYIHAATAFLSFITARGIAKYW